MKVYVAGSLADIPAVQEVQAAVVHAGHCVVLDWTRGPDVALTDYANDPVAAARIAGADLQAVLEADAVLVVASEHPGRGMFVELGATLARVERGEHVDLVVIGPSAADSVFYFHPAVLRCAAVSQWLASV